MPTLNITKTYSDGSVLNETDLDGIKNSIEVFVNTTKLDADNLQDGAVTNAKLGAASVTTAKIAEQAVETSKIDDGAVTTVKVANNAVTEDKQANTTVSSTSSDVTIADTDNIGTLLVTTASDTITVTLPTAADNDKRQITIKKVDSGAGSVTVDGEGAETIDGETTLSIPFQYNHATLVCDGSSWHIIDLRIYRNEILNATGSGDFTGGLVRISRINNIVTVTCQSQITFASSSSPASAVGFIPDWARPPNSIWNVYAFNSERVFLVKSNLNGQLAFTFSNWAGGSASTTIDGGGIWSVTYRI